uniref:Cyclic nucleotide-binding domain-containing protein n=1 Tax=Globisporangium ultimum (strain ATCC 200006 / CBS 805.95 / DAOM BR144) TaxID=431595 RepID=K3X517_GLOUD
MEPTKSSSLFSRRSNQRGAIVSGTNSNKPSGRRGRLRSANQTEMLDQAKAQDLSLSRKVGDKIIKTLTHGQGFSEMVLLMNYPRTVNRCVLRRHDFQQVLTQYPEAREKVIPAMLSTCMVGNAVNGVYCPLHEMMNSVYSVNADLGQAASLSAKKAALIISDVICLSLDGKSILYRINASLKHELTKKRDQDLEYNHCSHASRAGGMDHIKHHEPSIPSTGQGILPSSVTLEARSESTARAHRIFSKREDEG